MTELEQEKILVFTPSRKIGGKRIVCYDDRYIVSLAAETDGIIVSNDTYRDLQAENPNFRKAIEERLLMYLFVNDRFMPPEDPHGRYGPSLDQLLRKEPLATEPRAKRCPYAKCTFGAKCRFYHPERANSSLRPSPSPGTGDKPSGAALDSPANVSCKTKITSKSKSYEQQKTENQHLHLKLFRSDPTASACSGHLALAKQLSHEYKCTDGHNTDSNVTGCRENKSHTQAESTAHKPERLHQRLQRTLAFHADDNPHACNLEKTCNAQHGAERSQQDVVRTSNELPVYLPANIVDDVSSCSMRNSSCTDTASNPLLDSNRSLSCANQPGLPQHPSPCNDPQHFITQRRASQDHIHMTGVRLAPPFLSSSSAVVDSLYAVRPVVLPYDYMTDFHSCRQFPAPHLLPTIPVPPRRPQMFVYQSRSYLPRNEHHVRPSVISGHPFFHR